METLLLPDTSPLITYSSAWTPAFARQPSGFDETLHFTHESNQTLALSVEATSLSFVVDPFDNCQAVVAINDSSPITACSTSSADGGSVYTPFGLYGLPQGLHQVQWSSGSVPSNQEVVLWGIEVGRPMNDAGQGNLTVTLGNLPSAGVDISASGSWSTENGSLECSSTGAELVVSARASAIYLYGSLGSEYGSASVAVDNQTQPSPLNFASAWNLEDQLLWFGTGLTGTEGHTVKLTTLRDAKVALSFAVITMDRDLLRQTSDRTLPFISRSSGKIVVGILIPGVTLLLALGGFLLYRRWQKRRLRHGSLAYDGLALPSTAAWSAGYLGTTEKRVSDFDLPTSSSRGPGETLEEDSTSTPRLAYRRSSFGHLVPPDEVKAIYTQPKHPFSAQYDDTPNPFEDSGRAFTLSSAYGGIAATPTAFGTDLSLSGHLAARRLADQDDSMSRAFSVCRAESTALPSERRRDSASSFQGTETSSVGLPSMIWDRHTDAPPRRSIDNDLPDRQSKVLSGIGSPYSPYSDWAGEVDAELRTAVRGRRGPTAMSIASESGKSAARPDSDIDPMP